MISSLVNRVVSIGKLADLRELSAYRKWLHQLHHINSNLFDNADYGKFLSKLIGAKLIDVKDGKGHNLTYMIIHDMY